MNISDILVPNAIKVPLESTDKRAIIDELVDLLAANGLIEDADRIKAAVWEREQERSTGIGEGLAIPHGKCECTKTVVSAVGRPAQPIDFLSVDKRPVRLVFLLVSPVSRTTEHVQALGKISRIMGRPETREKAYAAETAEELFAILQQADA